jgi:acetone carboxylase gamma subunit
MNNLIPYNLFEMSKYSEEDIKNLVKNFLEFVYAPAQQSEFKKIYERFGKKYNAISFGNEGLDDDVTFDRNFDLPTYGAYENRIFDLNTKMNKNHRPMIAYVELSFWEEVINVDIRRNTFRNTEMRLLKAYPYYKLENPSKFFDEIIKQINFFL